MTDPNRPLTNGTDVVLRVGEADADGQATGKPGVELRPVDHAFAETMLRLVGLAPAGTLARFGAGPVQPTAAVHDGTAAQEGAAAQTDGESDPLEVLTHAIARACWAPSAGHLCAELTATEKAALQSAPAALVRHGSEQRSTPLVLDDDAIYLDRCWQVETTIVEVVRRKASTPTDISPARAASLISQVFSDDPREASARAAAQVALTRQLSVITGGPGTGKTTVVKRLLRCLELHGTTPRVALAAPTGKAADRLAEQVQGVNLPLTRSTLHSLLGVIDLDAGIFRHGPHNPIAADLVVLDEASMVDADMMARLLAALWPETRVVLLGDPDQLRSVDYGAVLGDIVKAATDASATPAAPPPLAGAVARLTHVWRTDGKGIHALSDAIRRQDAEDALAAFAAYPDVTLVEPSTKGPKGLESLIRDRVVTTWGDLATLAPADGLKALRRLRILCAHRHGPRGVSTLNELIRTWLVDAGKIRSRDLWYEGRPLLILRNDRAMDLRNGNVGLIRNDEAWLDLDGLRSLPPSLLPDHATLYASTVHKAQGSEADEVIVLLPHDESPLLTRELLYTAITRAISNVIVIGSPAVVTQAIRTSTPRMSGVLRRLKP